MKSGGNQGRTDPPRLKIPSRERERIVRVIAEHYQPYLSPSLSRAALRRMIGSAHFALLLELHRLDGAGSRGVPPSYDFLVQTRSAYRDRPLLPERWIKGDHLMEIGYDKGTRLGQILEVAYDRQLEEHEASAQELLEWVKANYPSPPDKRSA